MKKTVTIVAILFMTISCGNLQQILSNLPDATGILSQGQIAQGLREALNNGVTNQVSKLVSKNGFYNNELVRIALPKELKLVDETLRSVGLSSLADEGIKALNNVAADAVKTATPIFVNAIKEIQFNDAKNILLGGEDAATTYLKDKTSQELYRQFSPVIKQSFSKVGADKIWKNLIGKYNSVPFIKKVNPDLTDYVTNQAMKGVFTMIAKEEQGIRKNVSMRTSNLLRSVFALQDR